MSGGSLLNGYVAQECDFRTVGSAEFDQISRRFARQIVHRGTLKAAPITWLYSFVLASLMAMTIGIAAFTAEWHFRLLGSSGCLVAALFLVKARGAVCSLAFAHTLFMRGRRRTRLREINSSIDHVICATDLNGAFPAYFSGAFVHTNGYWCDPGLSLIHI